MAGAWSGQRPTLATHTAWETCVLYNCMAVYTKQWLVSATVPTWHDEGWESANIHVIQRLGEWSLAFPKMKKRDWKGWGCG